MLRKAFLAALSTVVCLMVTPAQAQLDRWYECNVSYSLRTCASADLPSSARFTSQYTSGVSTGYYWGGYPYRVWINPNTSNGVIIRNQANGYENVLSATLVGGEGYYLWQTNFTYAEISFRTYAGPTLYNITLKYLSDDFNAGGQAFVTCANGACEKYDYSGDFVEAWNE